MNILEILNNNWFVSIVSIFLGFLIIPLLNRIGALFGKFSGKYIAVTFQPAEQEVLVEMVECKHFGEKIYGKIFGVCFAHYENNTFTLSKNNVGKYKFEGFVDERLFVLSYFTTIKTAKNAGTITLQGNGSGTAFEGVWGGFAHNQVVGSKCIWFLAKGKLNPIKDRNIILDLASKAINEYGIFPNSSKTVVSLLKQPEFVGRSDEIYFIEKTRKSPDQPQVLYINGEGGIGKTRLLKEVSKNAIPTTKSSDTRKIAKNKKRRK